MDDLLQAAALETEILRHDARARAAHASAIDAGSAAIAAIMATYDAAMAEVGEIDAERFDLDIERSQRDAVVTYSRSVAGAFSDADVLRWRAALERRERSWRVRLLAEEGQPGAASLLSALDPARDPDAAAAAAAAAPSLDAALARAARGCTCGHAPTRVAPTRTCPHCQRALESAWDAEERRLLARLPTVAGSLSAIVEPLLDELADLLVDRDEDSQVAADVRNAAARRQLRRATREHREAIDAVDLARWHELAGLVGLDTRPTIQRAARRARRTGLGAARLARIELHGNADVKARIQQRTLDGTIGSTRPQPFAWMRRLSGRDD